MGKFNVTAVSVEELLYEGAADEIIAPGEEGGMSIFSRHAPVLAALKKGILSIIDGPSKKDFEIKDGFIEVSAKQGNSASGGAGSFVNIFVRTA